MHILLRAALGVVIFCLNLQADVLIVADEFPAMEVVRQRLQSEEGRSSRIVDQQSLPADLAAFEAVVVYIHKDLNDSAEHAFITYAENGGRLVLLHHSISSGKRKNRDWFSFLGVQLPEGDVAKGGYKWIEGVTVQWVKLAGHFITTNRVQFPERISFSADNRRTETSPGFTLKETEVYLNHQLSGAHTLLLGVKFQDPATDKVWMQSTAGWYRQTRQGCVIYFMPGHTSHDFEDPTYGRLVLNAITAPKTVFK